MKRLFIFSVLMFIFVSIVSAATTSSNGYFYLPDVGDTGSTVHSTWTATQEATDAVIKANVDAVATSSGLSSSLSDETGTGLAVFSTTPVFTTHIDISNDDEASGVRASGALGMGKLSSVGRVNNETLIIDLTTTVDEIELSSDTGASNLKMNGLGFVPSFETADPCSSGMSEGALFWNATANELCACDGTNDVRVKDFTTACF